MDHEAQPRPWWRHGMVWLVISGPAVVVVAGFATLAIAITHPDPVLSTSAVAADDAATPAVQARNHVNSSPKLAPLASPEGSPGSLGRPGAGQAPRK
jgi:hypothetical protein